MITISYLLRSEPFMRAMLFGDEFRPVYARANGTLFEVDAVEDGQITLADGSGVHDVIILDVSQKTSEEAP